MKDRKLPSFQFYPGDWARDPVADCSLAAQGLWLRMMLLMHDSERYGYLCLHGKPMDSASIARRCRCTLDEYLALLPELDASAIPSRTLEGIIYSRRMVRDHKKREQSRVIGKRGGNPQLRPWVNPPVIPPDNHPVIPPLKSEDEDEETPGEGIGEGLVIVPTTRREAQVLTARENRKGRAAQ